MPPIIMLKVSPLIPFETLDGGEVHSNAGFHIIITFANTIIRFSTKKKEKKGRHEKCFKFNFPQKSFGTKFLHLSPLRSYGLAKISLKNYEKLIDEK